MTQPDAKPGLLALRALDLSDEKGFLCGRILADLGAEVIKVERPGGDPSRHLAPFAGDKPHPEKSLYWFPFNAGKKSVTLNLEAGEGQEIFQRLVKTADLVIESFAPGYLDSLGLGYAALSKVNPRIVLTSVTPYGQYGPYRDLKASDLTLQAMGTIMKLAGEAERPPLRLGGFDQGYYLAGVHAAAGSLIAYHHCQATGEGQHVDVSIFDCLIRMNFREPTFWEFQKRFATRRGPRFARGRVANKVIWKCQDGFVCWLLFGGMHGARENRALVEWMEGDGLDPGPLKGKKWEELDLSKITQEELESWEELFAPFFLRHTKKELEEGGRQRRMTLVPINDLREVLEDPQLEARGFWREIEHPAFEGPVPIPGHFFLSSAVDCGAKGRPPLIGEHNQEIYSRLGLSNKEIARLKQQGVL